MSCKRLRGWKLEEAMGPKRKKEPLEKGKGSNLVTALLIFLIFVLIFFLISCLICFLFFLISFLIFCATQAWVCPCNPWLKFIAIRPTYILGKGTIAIPLQKGLKKGPCSRDG